MKKNPMMLVLAFSAALALQPSLSVAKDAIGALDAKELRGKIAKKHMTAADPDKDGVVSKDEYVIFVEQLFRDADTVNDTTLDAKELKTKKDKALPGLTQ